MRIMGLKFMLASSSPGDDRNPSGSVLERDYRSEG